MSDLTRRGVLSAPILAAAGPSLAVAETLTVVTDIPKGHPRIPYFERVNAALGLAGIPTTLNADAVAYAGREVLDAVRGGKADLAWINAAHLEAIRPTLGVVNLPFLSGDDRLDRPGAAQRATAFLDGIASTRGIRILSLMRGADQLFIFKDRQPESLADMDGLQIRVAGPGIYERILNAAGARPVVLPIPRMKTAFEAGTLDGVFTSPGAWSSQLGMAAPHALRVPGLMMIAYVLVADAGQFATRGHTLSQVARFAEEFVTDQWHTMLDDDDRILAGMAAHGATIAVDDPASWRRRVAPVVNEFEAANPGVVAAFQAAVD